MADVVIKCEPMVLNLSPYGFHRYAKQFLETAREVKEVDGFSPVPYYLYCRSIELGLKSYLLIKKVPIKKLKSRKLGHNLCKLLRKSRGLDLEQYIKVNDRHINELKKANDYYASKGFEYFQVINAARAYKGLPDLKVLSEFAFLLVEKLEAPCWQAVDEGAA